MNEKIINYTNMNVYSDLLGFEVNLEIQQIIENGENICMVTHDSLNLLANTHNVKYDYSLKACNLDHAVVECRAFIKAKDSDVILREVIGIGETVTTALNGLSRSIPTQMAYKRAFDAAILSLFGLPAKMYSEIQLGNPETITPVELSQNSQSVANINKSLSQTSAPAPASETVAEKEDESSMFDIGVANDTSKSAISAVQSNINDEGPSLEESVSSETNNEKKKLEDTPVLFSRALEGFTFKDVKPTPEWLEWLNKEATEKLMQSRSKEVYNNFMAFRNYIA